MAERGLPEEIGYELRQLRLTARAATDLHNAAGADPKPWHAAAAAKYVSDIMLGLENIWKRRCRYLGTPMPNGPDSHRRILAAFLDDKNLGGRLSSEAAERLGLYLRFRHRFVHGYGFELRWEIVEEPLALIPDTVKRLTEVWQGWLKKTSGSQSRGRSAGGPP